MSGAAWHARVECGREVGAGFLVSARRLLTCAHVVRWADRAPVTVTFPGRRELGELSGTVVVHGGWQEGAADLGDLVVLELDREVPLAPAVFARPGTERTVPVPELIAYGFPKGYDEGMLASYRALPGPLISDEWVQLEAVTAHGQPLAAGFSGAALTLADGTVVGMVSAVAAPGTYGSAGCCPSRSWRATGRSWASWCPPPATGRTPAGGCTRWCAGPRRAAWTATRTGCTCPPWTRSTRRCRRAVSAPCGRPPPTCSGRCRTRRRWPASPTG